MCQVLAWLPGTRSDWGDKGMKKENRKKEQISWDSVDWVL